MKSREIAALGIAALGVAIALPMATAATAQSGPPEQMQVRKEIRMMPTTATLTASADVQAPPDIADIGAGVVTQAADAGSALRANSEQMNRVMAALQKAGIASRDIQTTGINLQPQYRFEQNQPPILTGFQASNRVQVTLREIGNAGKVIDALVAQGANQLDGPNFRISNPEPLLDKARTEAVRKARARADLYAAAAGMKVKRILSLSEGVEFQPPRPMARMQADAVAAAPPPVAPGEVGLTATVSMTFELE